MEEGGGVEEVGEVGLKCEEVMVVVLGFFGDKYVIMKGKEIEC